MYLNSVIATFRGVQKLLCICFAQIFMKIIKLVLEANEHYGFIFLVTNK